MKKSVKKQKQKKKPANRRSKVKYPNLDPRYNLKSRSHLFEADYLDKLNESEKAYLNKFNKEFINATFDLENPESNLHNTKELRSKCYHANNTRNKCALTKAHACGTVDFMEVLERPPASTIDEDEIISQIDFDLEVSENLKKIR